MLKLTTDKHEASRGLSATAELLVYYNNNNAAPRQLNKYRKFPV